MVVDNEFIKAVSLIYDDYTEQIIKRVNNSLPVVNKLEEGTNYTKFKNLCIFLQELNLLELNQVKLYIRVQHETVWKSSVYKRWKNKALPVNLFYNKKAIDRFTRFIEDTQYKVGKHKLEEYLDHYINLPLVPDENILSLNDDINLVVQNLKKIQKTTSPLTTEDLTSVILSIEERKIPTINQNSVCPAYLYLNKNLNTEDPRLSIFKPKMDKMNKALYNRGPAYIEKLQLKKEEIIKTIKLTTQEKETILPYV